MQTTFTSNVFKTQTIKLANTEETIVKGGRDLFPLPFAPRSGALPGPVAVRSGARGSTPADGRAGGSLAGASAGMVRHRLSVDEDTRCKSG